MKLCRVVLWVALTFGVAVHGDQQHPTSTVAKPVPPEIIAFAAAKRQQARDLASQIKSQKVNEKVKAAISGGKIGNLSDAANIEFRSQIAPEVWDYFEAIESGKYNASKSIYQKLQSGRASAVAPSDPGTFGMIWQPLAETAMAAEIFVEGEPKYALLFGNSVIASIPPGSIYFGGTDMGRSVVTALCKSHANADPFFTLTQNALADNTYLKYLSAMYGSRIYIPTVADSQKTFSDYIASAVARLQHDQQHPDEARQLKPGENVSSSGGRVAVSGQVAVMEINAALVRLIFDKNTNHEFFIEESWPLDWTYPYLSSHGFVLKINRSNVECLTAESVAADEKFWTTHMDEMIGPWLRSDTSISNICAYAEKVVLTHDLTTFSGDAKFVRNDYPMKTFSKLRSATAHLYEYRAKNAKNADERERMLRAADFAYRQAYALCPFSFEVVSRYAEMLRHSGRIADATKIAETTAKIDTSCKYDCEKLLKELRGEAAGK